MSSQILRSTFSTFRVHSRSHLPAVSLWSHKQNNNNYKNIVCAVPILAGITALAGTSLCDSDPSNSKNSSEKKRSNPNDNEPLTLNEAQQFLKEQLSPIRSKFFNSPFIQLEYRSNENFYRIKFDFLPTTDLISIISSFSKSYSKECNDEPLKITSTVPSINDKNNHINQSFNIILPNGTSSVKFESSNSKLSNQNGSFSYFNDHPFNKHELKVIIDSYESAITPNSQSKRFGGGGGGGDRGNIDQSRVIIATPKQIFGGSIDGSLNDSLGTFPFDFNKIIEHFHNNDIDEINQHIQKYHQQNKQQLNQFGGSNDDDNDEMGGSKTMTEEEAIEELEKLGMQVFKPDNQEDSIDWDSLAGYETLAKEIEDTVVMALQNGDKFDDMARKTRARFESNRPRAVLFEGPPGTGKTLAARILARRCGRPMILMKSEKVVSKWYGESTKNMSKVFDACEALGALLFIDEVDALASSRDHDIHEATKRILSIILQRVDGFQGKSNTTLVCATNRRCDLDAALLSRFDLSLTFPLPDLKARQAIFARYAKQLKPEDWAIFASASEGLSCRDIKEVCAHTERRWVATMIQSKTKLVDTPPLDEYLTCLQHRVQAQSQQGSSPHSRESPNEL